MQQNQTERWSLIYPEVYIYCEERWSTGWSFQIYSRSDDKSDMSINVERLKKQLGTSGFLPEAKGG